MPVLEGELAVEATRAARAIAVAVAADPREMSVAERALYWAYTSAVVDEPFAHAAYDAALDDLVAQLEGGTRELGLLAGGLAGCGWVLAHVAGNADDALAVIDDALATAAADWRGDHDLVTGAVGLAAYFLERPDSAAARAGLASIVAHLARTAVRTPDGATWATSPALTPEDADARTHGRYDCGLAHGVPGVIAVLARAGAVDLARDATRWLLAQRAPSGFPAYVYPGGKTAFRARPAWCYGDLGVANALWIAGTAPEVARTTALDCASREVAYPDAYLCHGTAGLAHACNRYYQASGDPRFADAARREFARALAQPRTRAGLVDGAAGVGLALHAAVTANEPGWDRLLLCDIPRSTGA